MGRGLPPAPLQHSPGPALPWSTTPSCTTGLCGSGTSAESLGRSHLLALEPASAEGNSHPLCSALTRLLPAFRSLLLPDPGSWHRQPPLPAAQPHWGLSPLIPHCVCSAFFHLPCRLEQFYRREQAQGRAAALLVDGTVLLYRC